MTRRRESPPIFDGWDDEWEGEDFLFESLTRKSKAVRRQKDAVYERRHRIRRKDVDDRDDAGI